MVLGEAEAADRELREAERLDHDNVDVRNDAAMLYNRMLAVLHRRGYEKPAWLTPAEFATLMGRLGAIARAIGRDI